MSASAAFEEYARDASLLAGGGAAILLQLLDPVVARGVAAHSAFARDPVGRLRGTLEYVYAIALGEEGLRTLAAARVDAMHRGVPGAREAEHQLWVAATLHAVGTAAYARYRRPLAEEVLDEVYARAAAIGTALQLPPEVWPADRAAFDVYWAGVLAEAEVGEDARRVAHDLLRPAAGPRWLRAAMPLVRIATADLLPPAVRDAYGLPARPRLTATTVALARVALRIAPRRLRELPARRLLAGLEERSTRRR